MDKIVECPECGFEQRLPDDWEGKPLKCYRCGKLLPAAGGSRGAAPGPPAAEDRPIDPISDRPRPAPRPLEQWPGSGGSARNPYERNPYERDPYEYEERRPRRHREGGSGYLEPARGGTILTLGICSIVFFICPIVGLILGILATSKAGTDLKRMELGSMDASGEGTTRAGQICGIIGIVLSVLNMIAGVVLRMNNQL